MASWSGDCSRPVVSVCCIAFNHELYIEDAIRGFLIQETKFPIEIVIHDDASTDRTLNIVKKYVSEYPEIIKPILQTVNQYTRKRSAFVKDVFDKCRGRFIALCEGDDYWVCSQKLQAQVDVMQKKPGVNFSFHPVYVRRGDVLLQSSFVYDKEIYSLEETLLADFHFIQTCSIMFLRDATSRFDFEIMKTSPIGDVFIRIWAINGGGAVFFDKVAAVYRQQSSGSWSSGQCNARNFIDTHINIVKSLQRLNVNRRVLDDVVLSRYIDKYKVAILSRAACEFELHEILRSEGLVFMKSEVSLVKMFFRCLLNSIFSFLGRVKGVLA